MQVRLEDAQGILTPHYSKLVSEAINLIKSRSSKPFERPFLQQLYQAASNALKTQFFDAGYILAYLLLCECEARNLTAITIGKQLGLQEEEISQSLFML